MPPMLRIIGALLLCALVVVACVESVPTGPVIPLVPTDAVAAVIVESPYKLFSSCDAFWKAGGFDALAGLGLEDLLKSVVPNAEQAAKVLDFARPWALVLLPSDSPKDVKYSLFIPYRSDPESFLATLLGSSSPLKVAAKAKSYVMLSDGQSTPAFPAAKTIDTKALARYPAGSVKLWGDVKRLAAILKDSYTPIEDAMRNYLADPSKPKSVPDLMKDPDKMVKTMIDSLTKLFDQIDSADAALVVNADGMTIRSGAKAGNGSDIQKLLAKAAKGGSALDWVSQVDSSALYGLSWAMNYADSIEVLKKYLRPVYESMGFDKTTIDALFRFEDKYSKVVGDRGALSFDLDIDMSTIANAGSLDSTDTKALAEFMKKLFSFKLGAVMEAKDEATYRTLMRGLGKDPDLNAFSKLYSNMFGLDLAFTSEEKKDGSFSYIEIGFSMKVNDPSKLGFGESMSKSDKEAFDTLVTTIGSMFKIRCAVSGGKCFMTIGDVAALKTLMSRKAAPASLVSLPSYAAFSKMLPKKPVCILSISAARLGEMLSGISSATGETDSEAAMLAKIDGLSTWYFYLSVLDESSAEAGFFIPISDIRGIAEYSVKMNAQSALNGDDA